MDIFSQFNSPNKEFLNMKTLSIKNDHDFISNYNNKQN